MNGRQMLSSLGAGLLLPALVLVVYFVRAFLILLLRQRSSPLRSLRGPPSPSRFFGNLCELHDQENNNLILEWTKSYGHTFVYRGFIGGCRLMTTDLDAVRHILGHAYDYPKPDFIRDSLATMSAGHDGLLTVEGEDHRRQVSRKYIILQILALIKLFQRKILVGLNAGSSQP
jgi:hypothetical protein